MEKLIIIIIKKKKKGREGNKGVGPTFLSNPSYFLWNLKQ